MYLALGDGGGGIFYCKKYFICAILRLYAEFQCPTRLGTGQKVCVGVVYGAVWWCGVKTHFSVQNRVNYPIKNLGLGPKRRSSAGLGLI